MLKGIFIFMMFGKYFLILLSRWTCKLLFFSSLVCFYCVLLALDLNCTTPLLYVSRRQQAGPLPTVKFMSLCCNYFFPYARCGCANALYYLKLLTLRGRRLHLYTVFLLINVYVGLTFFFCSAHCRSPSSSSASIFMS
jgi:hypothetical protein